MTGVQTCALPIFSGGYDAAGNTLNTNDQFTLAATTSRYGYGSNLATARYGCAGSGTAARGGVAAGVNSAGTWLNSVERYLYSNRTVSSSNVLGYSPVLFSATAYRGFAVYCGGLNSSFVQVSTTKKYDLDNNVSYAATALDYACNDATGAGACEGSAIA